MDPEEDGYGRDAANTVTADRVDKPAEYSMSGITYFWRVEPDDGPALYTFELARTTGTCTYVPSGALRGTADIAVPFPLLIDLAQPAA
jgi:hypothetical protein